MDRIVLSEKIVNDFQTKILFWYKIHKRDFPWRKTTDPYYILVSEVMLQQTQAVRVVPYYEKFIKRFPSFKDFALAKNNDVLKVWSGLGFNNRAIRLKEIAKIIQNKFKGVFPQQNDQLLALKGIGNYTAAAVLAFAFNRRFAVIDTNIRRVLIHELHLSENISQRHLSEIAFQLIPKGRSRIWHNALMDYGALEATVKQTNIKSRSKQSPFKGSEREVRGKILRFLLEKKKVTLVSLVEFFPHKNIEEIIIKMKRDGLIIEVGRIISISK
ncbi:MAG: Fe-S cluster assembly protein HesB [Ignavibacteria bacterium CG08_land_8_20_14_0_20_37_9]|nr:MAG: Fe-S cluster assembly protein HesB [Ignavibacteria bacterium CG08_land_8_20_14_0_20_37_9]